MPSDLELIKQLEKELRIEFEEREFGKIEKHETKHGYAIDKNGNVIGLDLDNIKLEPVSQSLSKLRHLKKLSLYGTQIRNISFLKGLTELNTLYLSSNQIRDISSLRRLNRLTTLYLSSNQITDISPLQELGNLTTLYLSSNQITDISPLQELGNLTTLYLSSNQITDISFLQRLKNLEKLDLRQNGIKELPEFIIGLEIEIDVVNEQAWENKIYLYGNPLEKPPMEIVKKGKEAIKTYFESLKKEKTLPLNEVKVLLVGDGGAGKTSLVKVLLGQKFDINEAQTHGININHWKVKEAEKEIKVNIWDFGGQKIMHTTHQFFLSKRSLYILVLDVRKDEKPEYWLKNIKSFGGDSPVLVVINKIDENPAFEINRKFLEEKYKNIKGFYRVSCKTKEGIASFDPALKKALSQVRMLRITWAASWINVKTRLENLLEHFISYEEYLQICKLEKITEESNWNTLLDLLNDLGVVLYFKDSELEDTLVLEPKWIMEAVYKIINSEKIANCNGVLKLSLLDEILKQNDEDDYVFPPDKYRYIIVLMQKLELCYPIDDQTVMIPELLEVREPSFDFYYTDALKFIIQYDFLPRSIIPRFIVRIHKDIKGGLQWRTGVVLEDKDFDSTAVIKSDNEAKRIYIYVNGGQKRDYFSAILKTLRRINQSFEKLKTRELIPMPDDPDITVNYKHLIRLEQEGLEYYFPGESDKKYKVKDLLGSFGDVITDDTMRIFKEIKMSQLEEESKEEDNP